MAANERQEASWDDLKAEIDLAIDSLPDDLRQPVVLCYLEGKTQVAAAEDLAIAQTTVSARRPSCLISCVVVLAPASSISDTRMSAPCCARPTAIAWPLSGLSCSTRGGSGTPT